MKFGVLVAVLLKNQMWRCVAGQSVSSLYYRDRLATVSGHPLPSSTIPPPNPNGYCMAFLALKRKALIVRNVGYFSSQRRIPENVSLRNVGDACHLAVES